MSTPQIEIQIIASLVALACAIPGVFLVLRKMAMISDAISHAILPGIVVGFILTNSINSPLLIVLAALTGVLTVTVVELISKTRLVKEDAAIGLVFPALFSIGVILISKGVGNIHLDTDSVLLGELAFAPFDRLVVSGVDIGPKSAWVMGAILIINLLFTLVFFKELKISTFDPGLAKSLGFVPVILNYALMSTVSITTVGAFDAVGAILVVAFMIAPAATAYLITDRLKIMIFLAALIGVIAAISGYWMARFLDASIAGSMATMCGIIFLFVFLTGSKRGIISVIRRKYKQKFEFAQMTLVMHIENHSGENDDINERRKIHLKDHFGWDEKFIDKVAHLSVTSKLLEINDNVFSITYKGKQFVDAANSLVTARYHPGFAVLRKEFSIFAG
nr:metal ABC transporter permease [Bacteroidota bacterium]